MTEKKLKKFTKTIISEILPKWSAKANGIPKQEVIDSIFEGLLKGKVKKGGEHVTEYTYIDQASSTRYKVDFAAKTVQVDDKKLFIFVVEAEQPNVPKETKAKKTKSTKENKGKATPAKSSKTMEQQRQEVKDFLDKNFNIGFTKEAKVKTFQILNNEDKQLVIDFLLGGLILCVINNTTEIEDPNKAVRLWVKSLQPVVTDTEIVKEDVTQKSPSPRKSVAEPVAAKAKKAKAKK